MSFFKRLMGAKAEATDVTPPQPSFGTPKWYPTHRHKKGGGYRLLGYGINEADRTNVAIYDDADGTVWVRSRLEFDDGRFTPISLVDPQEQTHTTGPNKDTA